MFEYVGLLYGLAKDIKNYFNWKDEIKLVSFDWVEKSGFKKEAEKQGITLRWSQPDKIETRILDGYDIMYEFEKINRVRKKIILDDGSVLIGKRG